MNANRQTAVLMALGFVSAGCTGTAGPQDGALTGPTVGVNVAALNLQGVGDVVWDVEVVNGADPAQVVWQRRLASSGYGDGAGSASYVGPCDADPAASENTVKVWVVGVYSAAVTGVGTFNSGSTADGGAVTGSPMPFQNPTTTAAPLTRTVTCEENADVFVQFDVALMRPAQQGFFDIAVNFNNIFCSAKFDCCTENAGGDACASDIDLLFEAGGSRGPTMVLGFACTAGANANVDTELYLDALALDCTSPTAGSFAADITLDPSGAAGNQCTAGADGMSTCAAVTEANGVDADTYLYQLGVYRGLEQLTSGGVAAQKVYWNVALGVKRPAIASCWLKTQGTADDAAGTSVVGGGTIAAGAVYPFIQWEVDLNSCMAEPLSFGDANAMVRPEYTTTGGDAMAFGYGYGANLAASVFGAALTCGGVTCPDIAGYTSTCNDVDHCEYAPTTQTAAWQADDVWIYVPPGSFPMGAPSGEAGALATEQPVHTVTFAAGFLFAKYPVTTRTYEACEATSSCTALTGLDWDGTGLGINRTSNGRGLHPQNGVTWDQAGAVCAWLGGRRPSDAEWEYAANGSGAHRKYPWGDTPEPTCANGTGSFHEGGPYPGNWGCGAGGTVAVGLNPAGFSAVGADTTSNAYTWGEDWTHSNYTGAPTDGSAWVSPTSSYRRLQGASFAGDAPYLRTSSHTAGGDVPTMRDSKYAARCVRSIPVVSAAPSGFTCTGTICENPTSGEVWVPAGDFWMGCNSVLDANCAADESSQHRVTLSAYAIDKTEVTAAEYKACVTAAVCSAALTEAVGAAYATYNKVGKENHPINHVVQAQGMAYCAWSGKAAGAQRLCTEAEWEKAARGGCDTVTGDCSTGAQMRKYPWDAGDGSASVAPSCMYANFNNGGTYCEPTTYTAAVGARPAGASPYGADDMAGNVWEWVTDWWAGSYAAGAVTDPTGPVGPASDVVRRGGSFVSSVLEVRASKRLYSWYGYTDGVMGFRCCRSTP